uniref:Uncharacterized protein n=1 Tax=Avena sativa TaxID=4498 RepID=A0ACD5ZUM4_AVESA
MSSLKFDLPQLDYTTRFSLWQVKMRAILAQTSDLDEALDGFGEKDAKTWSAEEKRKDRKALSLIQLHLSNNILQEVLEMKSTAALWEKLETICVSKDLTSKMNVKMKLFSHRLQEYGLVMNHISVFKEIVSDLQSMEVKYDDEDLALLLLCSLPSSYTHFRDTILLRRDELTLAEVHDALKQRKKMKTMVGSDGTSSKAEALQVRGRTEQRYNNYGNRDKSKDGRSRSKYNGKDKFCRYCKKSNHVIDDCWKLQNKEKRNRTYQPKDRYEGTGKAAVVSDSSDGECLAVFAACASRDDEWILDTACSFHICCNKDWFSSYESVQTGDFVRVENDNPCHIVGVGSVKIRTHDGVTRTLSEVKHIPSMARNLISLSTMDVDGYKYAGGHRVLKVSKGSLIHVIGDMNSAKLYVLRGSTLPDIDAAVTSNDSDDCGKTHMWHMRLGHMSEQGMEELVKRELVDGCNLSKFEFCEHCIFDVKTAFLHGELDEEIYMDQPEGFIVPGKEDFVGLKQSPRQWYKSFDSFMISHGFERSKYDSCVYIKFVDGSPIYLLLYVDDMLIAAKGMKEITTLKAHLSSEFGMKDLGAAKKILGMEITRDRKSVSQCPTTDEEFEYMSKMPYSSAVGSLMYAMVCSRPDLSYAMSLISRYMANPGKEHWKADQWVFRYLLGTSNACLKLGRTGEGLVGYVDSDFTADLDKRRSLTGYVFNVGGCAVSWKATLQAVVAQSTTKAEYMAIAEAYKESVWLKSLFAELCGDDSCITLFCDSQSAIYLTKDQMFHERTKHIDVKYHFVRDIVAQGKLKPSSHHGFQINRSTYSVIYQSDSFTLSYIKTYILLALLRVFLR